jgi:hypothetical protein
MIDGAPQIHPPASDPNDHLVEVPSLARPWAAPPQIARDQGTEFQHPPPHRLIGDIEPALGQEILDYVYAYLTNPFGAWRDHFRFARAASAHAIQHLGNEASLPSLADVNEAHARFDERREMRLALAE